MYLVDTNIFLRTLIKESEASFEECYALLGAVKTNQIKALIAGITLTEVSWTLLSYYKFPKKDIVTALRSILNLRGLRIVDNYNHAEALDLFESRKVRYIDALIASIDEVAAKEWIVVSYDKDFDKLDVVRQEPREVLAQLA